MRQILKSAVVMAAVSMFGAGCGVGENEAPGGAFAGTSSASQSPQDAASAALDAANVDDTSVAGVAAWIPGLQQRVKPSWQQRLSEFVLPEAHATACILEHFSACDNGVRTRNFNGCGVGGYSADGAATLTFSEANCTFAVSGDSVTRTADFTITGRRDATVQVSSDAGGGQTLTRTDDGFTYTVGGMHRIGTNASGAKVFDFSTKTTQDIVVTGTSRADRVLVSGTLEVTHNLKNYVVDWSVDHVAWTNACTCPVSGSLNGTLTGSVTGSATLTFTGCGTADLDWNGTKKSITFDNCSGT